MKWHHFTAEAAAEITGTIPEQQRVRRNRGYLAPLVARNGIDGVMLAEMALVQHLMPYGVMQTLTVTARARAAACIAYHAAVASGADPDAAAKILPGDQRQHPSTHMLVHIGDKHWRDTILTDDISDALARDAKKPCALVVDLVALGKTIAERAARHGGLIAGNERL